MMENRINGVFRRTNILNMFEDFEIEKVKEYLLSLEFSWIKKDYSKDYHYTKDFFDADINIDVYLKDDKKIHKVYIGQYDTNCEKNYVGLSYINTLDKLKKLIENVTKI